MLNSLLILLVFVIVVDNNDKIDEDYYLNPDHGEGKNEQTDNEHSNSESEDTINSSTYISVNNDILLGDNLTTNKDFRSELNYDYEHDTTYSVSSNSVSTSSMFPLFEEYFYEEDNDSILLRSKDLTVLKQIVSHKPNRQLNETNYYPNFLNLKPKIGKVNLIRYQKLSYQELEKTKKVWYVPYKFYCSLKSPLMSGSLERKRTTDIFQIHENSLTNVKMAANEITFIKPTNLHKGEKFNAWCTISPCYGDHTLCLFQGTSYSKLCDESYVVKIPKTYEQVLIINIVNSMRSSVATQQSERYKHLLPAADMNQIMYDLDLQEMAQVWLHQCVPGPAPCVALNNEFVAQLECTKYASKCCLYSHNLLYNKQRRRKRKW